jgi:hypothetical protein
VECAFNVVYDPHGFSYGLSMLLLWPDRWDASMVWTMCLSMLVSMIHQCLLFDTSMGHYTWHLATCNELSLKQQEAGLLATGATGDSVRPPSLAAPGCGRTERPHTPKMRADVTARSPREHPNSQPHKGMELRNSAGMYQRLHTISSASQAPKHLLVPNLPRDSPHSTEAAKEGVDGRVHLVPGGCTVS